METVKSPLYCANYQNISMGNGCGIGSNAYITALNAQLIIKDNCAIAEGLTVHTGNHARIIGIPITQITESIKPKGYDHDVIIEEDVWVGAHVTILQGVTIGRGATIAAGAVVTKDMPPYSICGGIPAKPLKFYWTVDQILAHEEKLYKESDRYTKQQLESFLSHCKLKSSREYNIHIRYQGDT